MNSPAHPSGMGASQARKEDYRFITGQGRYTDDLRLPDQAFAFFVRSPHAHARILSVDTSAALAAPGVIGVLTGADYDAEGLNPMPSAWDTRSKDGSPARIGRRPALVSTKACYAGDHVAVVIAQTREQAKDAAELVMVDYEPLPAVTSARAALESGAPEIHPEAPGNCCFDWETGDRAAVDAAFARAAHTVSLDLQNSRLIPNAMEPRASNAVYDAGKREFTLHLTTQNPHGKRTLLSAAIGLGILTSSHWRWDHKTVLSLVGWGIFALLLAGRYGRGWRGRHATRWLYAGALVLLLAYVGSRFVMEVLLSRSTA